MSTNNNEEIEPGEPIAPLAELGQDVSPQFLRTLRQKIYRRTTANQMVSFSWNLPKLIFLELMSLIAHFIGGASKEKAKL